MFRRGTKATEPAADAERQALFEELAKRPESVCPFLGLAGARSEYGEQVTDEHRCFAFGDPEPVSGEQQRNVCLQLGYANCPRYLRGVLVIPTDELEALRRPPQRVPPPPPPAPPTPAAGNGGRRRPIAIIVILLLLAGGGAWWMLAGPGLVALGPTSTPRPEPTAQASGESSPSATGPSESAQFSPEPSAASSPITAISGTSSFSGVGTAVSIADGLRLTGNGLEQAGAAWFPQAVVVANGFTVDYTFRLTDIQGGGGDGIAFVVQTQGPTTVGGSGEQLGYGGVGNSMAVELDTFFNDWPGVDDPNDNHVSIHTGGTGANTADEVASLGASTSIPNVSDGQVHAIRIVYVPGSLSVLVDTVPALQVSIDLASEISLGPGGTAFVGFTGSTGDAAEYHDLLTIEITFP